MTKKEKECLYMFDFGSLKLAHPLKSRLMGSNTTLKDCVLDAVRILEEKRPSKHRIAYAMKVLAADAYQVGKLGNPTGTE